MPGDKVVTRTVELRAWRFTGEDAQLMPEWVAARYHTAGRMALEITSEQGILLCQRGDWVVEDLNGDVGVCSADVFARRYQSLSGDASTVRLAMQTSMFLPGQWSTQIVERAAEAFHEAYRDPAHSLAWFECSEPHRAATRLAIRKALTAAISVVNRA